MRKVVAVAAGALLALAGCAGYARQARTVQKQVHAEKVETMGTVLDIACDGLLVTDVRDAMRARPNLRAGLPLVCPDSVGALMGLAAQTPPSTMTLKIEMAEPGAAAAE